MNMSFTFSNSSSICGVQMNFDLFPHAPLSAGVAKFIDGNQGLSELIIPHNCCIFFVLLGCSISVTARILLSGGSKKMMELSATFSAEMMVPPNLTAVLNVNFEGDNFKLILRHNSANLSICFSSSGKVFANKQKSSMFLRTWKSSSSFVPPSVIQLNKS